jgi:hypothetical protein
MGNPFKSKKGPSTEEIVKQQEAAAMKERERIAQEQAINEATDLQQQQKSFATAQSKRQAFAMGSQLEDDETNRRKFLKGV